MRTHRIINCCFSKTLCKKSHGQLWVVGLVTCQSSCRQADEFDMFDMFVVGLVACFQQYSYFNCRCRVVKHLDQRRLDKVRCTMYKIVELVKESLPIDLFPGDPEQASCNKGAELEMQAQSQLLT